MFEDAFDPEVYQLEDELLNYLIQSPIFMSKETYFMRIFGLFITRKILTQEIIREVTGLSAGKVSEEVNQLLDMGLIEIHDISDRGKITYISNSAGATLLKYTKHIISQLIEWSPVLKEKQKELKDRKQELESLNGYDEICNLYGFFIDLITKYEKYLGIINHGIKSLE